MSVLGVYTVEVLVGGELRIKKVLRDPPPSEPSILPITKAIVESLLALTVTQLLYDLSCACCLFLTDFVCHVATLYLL